MGLLAEGMTMLGRSMASTAPTGSDLTYVRAAGGASVTITDATPGRGQIATKTAGGAGHSRAEFGERDYLIPVASLVQSGSAFVPAKGDRITESINGTSYTFECTPREGQSPWDWCDDQRTRVRVRCKRVMS